MFIYLFVSSLNWILCSYMLKSEVSFFFVDKCLQLGIRRCGHGFGSLSKQFHAYRWRRVVSYNNFCWRISVPFTPLLKWRRGHWVDRPVHDETQDDDGKNVVQIHRHARQQTQSGSKYFYLDFFPCVPFPPLFFSSPSFNFSFLNLLRPWDTLRGD